MFWVHSGSEEHGGELFGRYDTVEEASQSVARLALGAFENDKHNVGARSYTILEADTKDEAEQIVKDQFPELAGQFERTYDGKLPELG